MAIFLFTYFAEKSIHMTWIPLQVTLLTRLISAIISIMLSFSLGWDIVAGAFLRVTYRFGYNFGYDPSVFALSPVTLVLFGKQVWESKNEQLGYIRDLEKVWGFGLRNITK